jgi:hypothetical protein
LTSSFLKGFQRKPGTGHLEKKSSQWPHGIYNGDQVTTRKNDLSLTLVLNFLYRLRTVADTKIGISFLISAIRNNRHQKLIFGIGCLYRLEPKINFGAATKIG